LEGEAGWWCHSALIVLFVLSLYLVRFWRKMRVTFFISWCSLLWMMFDGRKSWRVMLEGSTWNKCQPWDLGLGT
jgi:hypothetical protein